MRQISDSQSLAQPSPHRGFLGGFCSLLYPPPSSPNSWSPCELPSATLPNSHPPHYTYPTQGDAGGHHHSLQKHLNTKIKASIFKAKKGSETLK